MMGTNNFNYGTFIYIDDKVNTEKIAINLSEKLKSKYISVIFEQLPSFDYIENNSSLITMIIMDWQLWDKEKDEVMKSGDYDKIEKWKITEELYLQKNVNFISKTTKLGIPITIFTNQSESELTDKINEIDNQLLDDNNQLIIIRKKTKDLSSVIDDWINKLPLVKIYSYIKKSFLYAQMDFFREMIVLKDKWINAVYNNFCKEYSIDANCDFDANKEKMISVSDDFQALLIKAIKCRVHPVEEETSRNFYDIARKSSESNKEDVKRILEATRFIENDKLANNKVFPGDVFVDNEGNYYINIRPECDTTRGDKSGFQLYVIKGEEIAEKVFFNKKGNKDNNIGRDSYLGAYNQLLFNESSFTIPFICGKKIIEFKLKKLYICCYKKETASIEINDLKCKRVGRVLEPYSLKIQQRFSSYISRIGIDSVPDILTINDEK